MARKPNKLDTKEALQLVIPEKKEEDTLAVLKTYIENEYRHKMPGTKRWSTDMETLRDTFIINKMTKGTPRRALIDLMVEKLGINATTAKAYIGNALDNLVTVKGESEVSRLRNLSMERLDTIYSMAIRKGDLKEARMTVETMAKIGGVFEEKNTTVVAPMFQFKFGGEHQDEVYTVMQNASSEYV